jgi:hypothetical protein
LKTSSPAAIVNWIRYQMGRRETRRAWGDTGLGNDVIRKIEGMRPQVEEIANQIYDGSPSNQEFLEIYVAMIQQYVGYMRRWFIARGGQ